MEYIPVLTAILVFCTLFIIGGLAIDIHDNINARRKARNTKQLERARVKDWCRIQCAVYDKQGHQIGQKDYKVNKIA